MENKFLNLFLSDSTIIGARQLGTDRVFQLNLVAFLFGSMSRSQNHLRTGRTFGSVSAPVSMERSAQ